jgi:Rha family phage regulatory protein
MGSDLVFKNESGQPVTSSLLVAQKFGKRHADVLRAIRDIGANISEVAENECERIFAFTSHLVEQPHGGWRESEYCLMTRDGFSLLVMGFAGKEAMRFKLAFLSAFNSMAEEIYKVSSVKAETREYIHSCVEQYVARYVNHKLGISGKVQPTTEQEQELDVHEDAEAYRFFDSYVPDSERPNAYLDKHTAREYYAGACVLNAIANMLQKQYGVKGRTRRYSQAVLWAQMAVLVQRVDISRFPHMLPTSGRRLRAKYFSYLKDGYASFVHRGFNNQFARKPRGDNK